MSVFQGVFYVQKMWRFCALVLAINAGMIWARPDPDAESKAQILITNRGEPAPFPHFPVMNELPPPITPTAFPVASEIPSGFVFAPTPSGRPEPAPPAPAVPAALAALSPQPLPEVQQALGQ